MRSLKIITVTFLAVMLGACAQGRYGGGDYTGGQSRALERVKSGVILAIAPAVISDKPQGLGGAVGAIGGGVIGSGAGAGRGQILTTLGGAVLGAIAGDVIDSQINRHEAVRITIRLDGGETVAVTQALDAEAKSLRVNDRVNIYTSGGIARVGR